MSNKLHVLQHSLGVDEYGRGPQYRNYFCAGPEHSDFETCEQLVAEGLMVKRSSRLIANADYLFQVTPAGIDWMRANSPTPPKLTRAQTRYRSWLSADCGLTFIEWLKLKATKHSNADAW